ncbi:Predicted O-methyltransferase YrrM [Saccharicrinis carchari]|uniref:Predicted O-methyltransferase YrrM n=1 Tax=Saccharicrinis carchari TaxID=1168039 RepID=A0A521EQU3_SACCC|nr:O-methyltransferase [Saccharicrinis carchari]SMO86296.1 Predicted O-methyltransferase YrrM [Saccharicrinis carchari]
MFTQNIDLEAYILEHIDKEDELLYDLNRKTHIHILRSRMLSGHWQGQILKMICRMIQPANILEIGTFTGYSSLCMAQSMPHDGFIDTIDIDDEMQAFTQSFFDRSGLAHKIKMHLGDALNIMPALKKKYDLIFIDGDKRQYPDYYHQARELLKPGGFMLVDNVLWDGKVIEPVETDDEYTLGIQKFNKLVKEDKGVEKVIFPIRDGIFVIRKKTD